VASQDVDCEGKMIFDWLSVESRQYLVALGRLSRLLLLNTSDQAGAISMALDSHVAALWIAWQKTLVGLGMNSLLSQAPFSAKKKLLATDFLVLY